MVDIKFAQEMLSIETEMVEFLRKRLRKARTNTYMSEDLKALAIEDYSHRLRKAEAYSRYWKRVVASLEKGMDLQGGRVDYRR